MATLTVGQSRLPNGHISNGKAVVAGDEKDRGSVAWVRRIVDKFKSSGKRQVQVQQPTVQHFKTEVVELSDATSKDKVYNIRKTDMFLAYRVAVPVPPEAQACYEQHKYNLMRDLDAAWRVIEAESASRARDARSPNQFISECLELRMSGRATGGSNGRVELAPTIWVRCSKHQKTRLEKALESTSMRGMHTTEFGRVMVGDAAKLNSTDASSPYDIPVGSGMTLDSFNGISLENITLHLEVEDPSSRLTLEGLSLRATLMQDGIVRSQNISKIGGLLSIDGHPVGLTTAHGILGNLWDALNNAGSTDLGGSVIAQEPVDIEDTSSAESSDDEFSCYAEFAHKRTQPASTPRKWIDVELGEEANFLGLKAIPVKGGGVPSTISFIKDIRKSDYALIHLDNIIKRLGMNSLSSGSMTTVDRFEATDNIPPGPVVIRLGEVDIGGLLLEHPASLEIFGVSIATQYIQLLKPMAVGSSGAWVIRDRVLCGMIIAGYEDEPCAHMIPASRLMSDIKLSIGKTGLTTFQGSLLEYHLNGMRSNLASSSLLVGESSSRPPATQTSQVTSPESAHLQQPQGPSGNPQPPTHSTSEPEAENALPTSHTGRLSRAVKQSVSALSRSSRHPRAWASERVTHRGGNPAAGIDLPQGPESSNLANQEDQLAPGSYTSPSLLDVVKVLENQGFNLTVAFVAASEYFASWCSLFTVGLVNSSIDSVDPSPDIYRTLLLSGLPFLAAMAVGMLLGGMFSNMFGGRITSATSLLLLLLGSIAMLVVSAREGSQVGRGALLSSEMIMALGIGSLSILPAVMVVEYTPTKRRTMMLAFVMSMQGFAQLYVHGLGALILWASLRGSGQATILSEPVEAQAAQMRAVERTWKLLAGLGTLPVVVAMLACCLADIPASPRFLYEVYENPQLALKAAISLQRKEKSVFSALGRLLPFLIMQPTSKPQPETRKDADIMRWFRGVPAYLFGNYDGVYRRNRYFILLCRTTVAWFFLNLAFFGMGLDNPQIISSTWGVTSTDTNIARNRKDYYIHPKDGETLLRGWIIVLEVLSGPAIVGYLLRLSFPAIIVYLLRLYFPHRYMGIRLMRKRFLMIGSILAMLSLGVFGSYILGRILSGEARQTTPTEPFDRASVSGIYVLVMYGIFQFAMSLAPSALQFAFAAEVFGTRYRSALLGFSSFLAMLGAISIRLVLIKVDYFKTQPSVMPIVAAGAILIAVLCLPRRDAKVETRHGTLTLEQIADPSNAYDIHENEMMSVEELQSSLQPAGFNPATMPGQTTLLPPGVVFYAQNTYLSPRTQTL
ncbi:major facilitator superfamily domain-containing protein [Podospora australis]|uniref:Major facilitator superfamily domain-containing protein n=1 Tax=Podospora australis TaxID=1536484 RepID=A0AAN6WQN5_9PEZI|nr:major facilitator superfamily domain-containing protein [Podospora australis]